MQLRTNSELCEDHLNRSGVKMAKKVRPGDVLAIPLKDDRVAFCRILKDACIGVYRYLSLSQDDLPPPGTEYLFIVGAYRDILTSGKWPRVGHVPFENEEEAWPPPMVINDPINGECSNISI